MVASIAWWSRRTGVNKHVGELEKAIAESAGQARELGLLGDVTRHILANHASDAVLASIIEAKRKEQGLPTLAEAERPPRWLETSASRGLGVADLASIRRVEG